MLSLTATKAFELELKVDLTFSGDVRRDRDLSDAIYAMTGLTLACQHFAIGGVNRMSIGGRQGYNRSETKTDQRR